MSETNSDDLIRAIWEDYREGRVFSPQAMSGCQEVTRNMIREAEQRGHRLGRIDGLKEADGIARDEFHVVEIRKAIAARLAQIEKEGA